MCHFTILITPRLSLHLYHLSLSLHTITDCHYGTPKVWIRTTGRQWVTRSCWQTPFQVRKDFTDTMGALCQQTRCPLYGRDWCHGVLLMAHISPPVSCFYPYHFFLAQVFAVSWEGGVIAAHCCSIRHSLSQSLTHC